MKTLIVIVVMILLMAGTGCADKPEPVVLPTAEEIAEKEFLQCQKNWHSICVGKLRSCMSLQDHLDHETCYENYNKCQGVQPCVMKEF